MSFEELVKRLRNCATEAAPCNTCDMIHDGSCSDTLMKQAADAIEELSRENESLAKSVNEASEILRKRWIPVTERLPDIGGRVLCMCRANIYEVMKRRTDNKWVQATNTVSVVYMSGFVTHWMPLPQPPKAEEGE